MSIRHKPTITKITATAYLPYKPTSPMILPKDAVIIPITAIVRKILAAKTKARKKPRDAFSHLVQLEIR